MPGNLRHKSDSGDLQGTWLATDLKTKSENESLRVDNKKLKDDFETLREQMETAMMSLSNEVKSLRSENENLKTEMNNLPMQQTNSFNNLLNGHVDMQKAAEGDVVSSGDSIEASRKISTFLDDKSVS